MSLSLRHDLCWIVVNLMHIRTIFVLTLRIFEEKFAVLSPSKRSPQKSAVSHTLIYAEYGNSCLMRLAISDVG